MGQNFAGSSSKGASTVGEMITKKPAEKAADTVKDSDKSAAKKNKFSKDATKERFESGASLGSQLADALSPSPMMGGGAPPPIMSDAPPPPNYTTPGPGLFGMPFAQASNQYLSVKSPFYGIPGGGERRKPLPKKDDEEEEDSY